MWNDQSAQGGGFFNSPNQFGAANTPSNKKKSGKRSSRTAPILISQALKCSDDGLKIWISEVQIACITARILNIKVESTKIVYTIQDMTGRMKAMLWIDQESVNEDEKAIPNVMVNTYVQIFGNVKSIQGHKVLVVFKMFTVTNMNAITFHYLQCINNKVKLEAKAKGPKQSENFNSSSAMPSNSMMMGGDMGGAAAGLNPRQNMVFSLIKAAKLETGISRDDMFSAIKDKMPKMELDKILEWMCGEGHIYSTIDEDHFRATDAS